MQPRKLEKNHSAVAYRLMASATLLEEAPQMRIDIETLISTAKFIAGKSIRKKKERLVFLRSLPKVEQTVYENFSESPTAEETLQFLDFFDTDQREAVNTVISYFRRALYFNVAIHLFKTDDHSVFLVQSLRRQFADELEPDAASKDPKKVVLKLVSCMFEYFRKAMEAVEPRH